MCDLLVCIYLMGLDFVTRTETVETTLSLKKIKFSYSYSVFMSFKTVQMRSLMLFKGDVMAT